MWRFQITPSRNFHPRIHSDRPFAIDTSPVPILSRAVCDNDAAKRDIDKGGPPDTRKNPKGPTGSDQRKWIFEFLSCSFDLHLTWVVQFSSSRLNSFPRSSPISMIIDTTSAIPRTAVDCMG